MDKQTIAATFRAAGVAVRIADQGLKFRICTRDSAPFADRAGAVQLAAALGLTDVFGVVGAQFNQSHELIAYKPGAIRRV